jgi:hypothetical protein
MSKKMGMKNPKKQKESPLVAWRRQASERQASKRLREGFFCLNCDFCDFYEGHDVASRGGLWSKSRWWRCKCLMSVDQVVNIVYGGAVGA